MDGLTIAVIGAGSPYTPELIEGLAARQECLPVREVRLGRRCGSSTAGRGWAGGAAGG
ncbi:hypothetical protein [Symbiobacterium sp.]|uniref:hypothetical protein n=1 Tax=Symbiobacterium sp. TaxID=1971213 RepID=UPI0034640642